MPNWVYNTLTIYGEQDKREALARLLGADNELSRFHHETETQRRMEEAEKRGWDTTFIAYEQSALDFHNLCSPPKEVWDEYVAVKGWGEGIPPVTENNWYEWRNKHWNTKWNAGSVEVEQDKDVTTYRFETAWDTISSDLITALGEAIHAHGLSAVLHFEEETGWGGEFETDGDGVFLITEQYEEPKSHADYELRDSECMCVLYEDDPEMWFADCPKVGE